MWTYWNVTTHWICCMCSISFFILFLGLIQLPIRMNNEMNCSYDGFISWLQLSNIYNTLTDIQHNKVASFSCLFICFKFLPSDKCFSLIHLSRVETVTEVMRSEVIASGKGCFVKSLRRHILIDSITYGEVWLWFFLHS